MGDSGTQNRAFKAQFEETGRVWFRNALSDADLTLLDQLADDSTKAGQRLDQCPALEKVLGPGHSVLHAIGQLDLQAKPVRVVAFNKSETANWGVPWHQDRVIAVSGRADVRGYKNWTKKAGTWHCEPPQSLLKDILFTRIHLDDTDSANGAMEIAVGSHAQGIVPSDRAEEVARSCPVEVCEAKRGDVLVLKMLTLHCSKPAKMRSGRRVLRVDFASSVLPPPLTWLQPSEQG